MTYRYRALKRCAAALVPLFVGTPGHAAARAMIGIDEEGAEAAATACLLARSAPTTQSTCWENPFVHARRDKVTGLICVAAGLVQPPKGKTA